MLRGSPWGLAFMGWFSRPRGEGTSSCPRCVVRRWAALSVAEPGGGHRCGRNRNERWAGAQNTGVGGVHQRVRRAPHPRLDFGDPSVCSHCSPMTAGSGGTDGLGPPRVRLVGPGSRSAARTTAPRLPGWRGCRPVVPRTPSWSTRRMPSSSDVAMCRASGRRARPGSRRDDAEPVGSSPCSRHQSRTAWAIVWSSTAYRSAVRTSPRYGGRGTRRPWTRTTWRRWCSARDQSPQHTRTSRSRPASSSK